MGGVVLEQPKEQVEEAKPGKAAEVKLVDEPAEVCHLLVEPLHQESRTIFRVHQHQLVQNGHPEHLQNDHRDEQ